MGWTTTTFCRFEVAAGLSENVPYIGPDGGDIVMYVLSGCETLGEKKRRHCTSEVRTLQVNDLHHDGTVVIVALSVNRRALINCVCVYCKAG
jgi:hypothetical protein